MTFNLSKKFSAFLNFEDAIRFLNVKPDEYYLIDTENLSQVSNSNGVVLKIIWITNSSDHRMV